MDKKKIRVYALACGLVLSNMGGVPKSKAEDGVSLPPEDMVVLDATNIEQISTLNNIGAGVSTIFNKEKEEPLQNISSVRVKTSGVKIISVRTSTKEEKLIFTETDMVKRFQESVELMMRVNSGNVPDGVVIPETGCVCRSEGTTYMGYDAVTAVSSMQYKLLNSEECVTDEETGIRMVNGRYCIAMGSCYANKIGTKINLIMKDGSVLRCILGDQKADADTDVTNRFQKYDGSVAEIIVDYSVFKGVPEMFKRGIQAVVIMKDDNTVDEFATKLTYAKADMFAKAAEAEEKAKKDKEEKAKEKKKKAKEHKKNVMRDREEMEKQKKEDEVNEPSTESAVPATESATEAPVKNTTEAVTEKATTEAAVTEEKATKETVTEESATEEQASDTAKEEPVTESKEPSTEKEEPKTEEVPVEKPKEEPKEEPKKEETRTEEPSTENQEPSTEKEEPKIEE